MCLLYQWMFTKRANAIKCDVLNLCCWSFKLTFKKKTTKYRLKIFNPVNTNIHFRDLFCTPYICLIQWLHWTLIIPKSASDIRLSKGGFNKAFEMKITHNFTSVAERLYSKTTPAWLNHKRSSRHQSSSSRAGLRSEASNLTLAGVDVIYEPLRRKIHIVLMLGCILSWQGYMDTAYVPFFHLPKQLWAVTGGHLWISV